MTKEERAKKKRARELEEEREAAEFPGAVLEFANWEDAGFIQIRLDDGVRQWIRLRQSKSAKWEPEHGFENCEYVSVNLGANIPALARLIRALVVRYNAIVKDINGEVSAIPKSDLVAHIDEVSGIH